MARKRQGGFSLLELLVVVAVIGVISLIGIPNLLNALDRGKQKRTMMDLRSIATALDSYSIDRGFYPSGEGMTDLLIRFWQAQVQDQPTGDSGDH